MKLKSSSVHLSIFIVPFYCLKDYFHSSSLFLGLPHAYYISKWLDIIIFMLNLPEKPSSSSSSSKGKERELALLRGDLMLAQAAAHGAYHAAVAAAAKGKVLSIHTTFQLTGQRYTPSWTGFQASGYP